MVTLNSRRERIEQLADLLDGTRAEDEVRSDVRRMATLASTVTREIETPVLDAEARDRIRTMVMAGVHLDLQEAEQARTVSARPSRSARAVVATGVASVVIGASGVAVAAQEALPGDALYGIKQATESVRMAAAGDPIEQGRLELALAAERLEEVTSAVDRGGVRDQDLIDTLARMDERSRTGAETLVRVAEREDQVALLEEVATFTEEQYGGIVDVFDRLPIQVRPHAEDSLATLRAIRDQLLAPAFGEDVSAAQLAGIAALLRSNPLPAAPAAPGPDEGAGSDDDVATEGTLEAPSEVGEVPVPPLPVPGSGRTEDDGGDRTVVPRLPGALDDVGRSVDEAVGGVIDGTGNLLENGADAAEDTLGGVGDAVDGVVDGTLDGVGDAVDGLLGRSRDRD